MTTSTNPTEPQLLYMPPPRRGVVDLLETLLRYAWLVAALALGVGLWVVVKGTRTGRIYAAESAFILDTERTSTGVSGIAAQFGIAIPQGGDAQSPGFYADLLRSPTIIRAIVDTPLMVPSARGPVPVRLIDSIPASAGNRAVRRHYAMQKLQSRIGVTPAQRTGVITVRVLDPNPWVALAINQRMLALLNEFNITRRRTQASEQRAFVGDRLEQARLALRAAEERMRLFLSANRGFVPSSAANFEQQRLERDLTTRSQVYLSLLQSFEQAKVDEIRAAPLIAVIQTPELPVGPEPRRLARKGMIGSLIGAVIGLFLAYLAETIRRARLEHPDAMAALSRALGDLRRNWYRPWRAIARPGPRSV